MKKCLVTVVIYGVEYQSYVPMFIYFLHAEYPEYDVRVYLDRELDVKYVQQLEQLKCCNYEIRVLNMNSLGFSKEALSFYPVLTAIRWFLLADDVREYEAVYCGDIDILIMHEEFGLFEQHMQHAKYMNLPYSNSIRIHEEKKTLRRILGNIKRHGIKETYRTFVFPISKWKQLTGLHFLRTEYADHINDVKDELINEINLAVEGKSSFWTQCSLDNESILYELMKRARFGVPEFDEDNLAVGTVSVENTNPNSVNFRPHHGLHLGIWRREKCDDEVALSDMYKSYYRDFKRKYLKNNDLQRIIKENDDYAERMIKRMIHYYERMGV